MEELFSDSVILFDDYQEGMTGGEIKLVEFFRDFYLTTGRHTRTSMILCHHISNDREKTKMIMTETSNIVLFSKSTTKSREYLLKTYYGFDKGQIAEVEKRMKAKDRWVSKSIDSLFGKNNAIILFYPGKKSKKGLTGHYTCLIKIGDEYHYYDSYGDFIDKPKQYSKQRNALYNEPGRKNSLIALLRKAQKEGAVIDYSHYKHQSEHPLVATCGRHCLTRCMRSDLTNDQYDGFITACAKKWKTDKDGAVSAIWNM
ncbi:hypothetical protein FNF29_08457 [Cafeteria roenbergensis]|nr:hypothetical protein FNF29_08457 [Cafeteria roenbergensis]|eukprot:KAA0145619.1 hypothetical protein FNF29_08457 [Cafeteria roenbergensis]